MYMHTKKSCGMTYKTSGLLKEFPGFYKPGNSFKPYVGDVVPSLTMSYGM